MQAPRPLHKPGSSTHKAAERPLANEDLLLKSHRGWGGNEAIELAMLVGLGISVVSHTHPMTA